MSTSRLGTAPRGSAQWGRASLARPRIVHILLALVMLMATGAPIADLVEPQPASANHSSIKWPVPSGATWYISQGYNTSPADGWSHYNCDPNTLKDQISQTHSCSAYYQYKFSFDIKRKDGNTAGQPVLSPVNGTIRWIDEAYGGMSINLGDGYAVAFFHANLVNGLAAGQTVTQGQLLGTVAPAGQAGNGGSPHIHITIWKTTDGGNWSRNAVPFTDDHKIDGMDFPHKGESVRNQYYGVEFTSSNQQLSAGSTSPPATPTLKSPATGTTYTSAPRQVTLSWNSVSGATEYQVVINDVQITSPWVSGTSWTTGSLGKGQYAWQVRARNSAGTSGLSPKWVFWIDTSSAQTPTPTPSAGGTPGPLKTSISPTSGRVGTIVTASGSGMNPNETVRLYFDSVSSAGQIAQVKANSAGNWAAEVAIPDATGGNHTIIARGMTSDKRAPATFTVTSYLNRTPYQGPPGTTINLTVQGFGANETVRVTWETTSGPLLANVQTNAKGTGSTSFPLPEGTTGWHDYVGVGQTSRLTAWGALYIQPALNLSPTSGSPGTKINVSAKGLAGNQSVTIAWNKTSSSAGTNVCSGSTNGSGNYSCSFNIPQVGAGSYPVVLTTSGGVTLSSTVEVSGQPSVSITPGSAAVGAQVSVSVGGFGANETVNLTWDNSSTVWQSRQTSANGSFNLTALVPSLSTGTHTLKARGVSTGRTASVSFTVVSGSGGKTQMVGPGTYLVTATEEGLFGGTTSAGHVIEPGDMFVALPACTQSSCPWANPNSRYVALCGDNCYVRVTNPSTGACRVGKVLDVGPWFTNDNWWDPTNQRELNKLSTTKNILPQGYVGAEAARDGLDVGYGVSARGIGISNVGYEVGNRAAIDLGDGMWTGIGFRRGDGIAQVRVTLLWQTGEEPNAAAQACGQSSLAVRQSGTPTPTPTSTATPKATATATATPNPTGTPITTRSLSHSPTSGPVGTTVQVTGTGFQPGETVDLYFTSTRTTPIASPRADNLGRISAQITMPEAPAGYLLVAAKGRTSGATASKSFKITPKLTRSPASGYEGQTIQVQATGFGASESVDLRWDSSSGTVVARLTTNANGSASGSFKIPENSARGQHNLYGIGATSGVSTSVSVEVLALNISVSPSTGSPRNKVTVSGSGFAPNETVDVFWDGSSTAAENGKADASGNVSITSSVPLMPTGSHPVKLKGRSSGRQGTAQFNVVQSVELNPTSGQGGTQVTVKGRGWDAGATVGIYWNRTGSSSGVRVCNVVASHTGSFTCSFVAPNATPERYPVVGVSGSRTASATFRVTGGQGASGSTIVASVSPESGSPRDYVTVTGTGFKSGETVEVRFNGSSTVEATGKADSNGRVSIRVRVPLMPNGARPIELRGTSSGSTGVVLFDVVEQLELSPTSGAAGSTFLIKGRGWNANSTVDIYWNRTGSSAGQKICTITASNTGSFTCEVKVPSNASNGTFPLVGISGDLSASASFRVSGSVSGSETSTIETSVSPESGSPRDYVTVTGTGFKSGETVEVRFNGASTVEATGKADSNGRVSIRVRVPLMPNGPRPVELRGTSSGSTGVAQFVVVEQLELSPTSGQAGSDLLIKGRGWNAGESVDIYWNRTDSSAGQKICTITASSTGSFTCNVKVPSNASTGTFPLVGISGDLTASTTYKVTGVKVASLEEPTEAPAAEPTEESTPEPATPEATGTPTSEEETPEPTTEATPIPTPEEVTPEPTETPVVDEPEPTPEATEAEDGEEAQVEESTTSDATAEDGQGEEAAPDEAEEAGPAEAPAPESEPQPTPEPVVRELVFAPVADTSVSAAAPDAPQAPEAIGTLAAGGPDGAVALLTFEVTGIAPGSVVEAKLALTNVGESGAAGGAVLYATDYWLDEAATYQTALVSGLPQAVGSDGAPTIIEWLEPWAETTVDVTGVVAADGTITFVIAGAPDSPLLLGSRESGAPPRLIVTVVEQPQE